MAEAGGVTGRTFVVSLWGSVGFLTAAGVVVFGPELLSALRRLRGLE